MSNIFDFSRPVRTPYTPKPHLQARLDAQKARGFTTDDKGHLSYTADWYTVDRVGNPVLKPKAKPEPFNPNAYLTGHPDELKPGDKVRFVVGWDKLRELAINGDNKTEAQLQALELEVVAVDEDRHFGSPKQHCPIKLKKPAGFTVTYWWVRRSDVELFKPVTAAQETTWDPMTEPLSVGDRVEVVYEGTRYSGHTGTLVAADPSLTNPYHVKYENGHVEQWGFRSSLKLLKKANA